MGRIAGGDIMFWWRWIDMRCCRLKMFSQLFIVQNHFSMFFYGFYQWQLRLVRAEVAKLSSPINAKTIFTHSKYNFYTPLPLLTLHNTFIVNSMAKIMFFHDKCNSICDFFCFFTICIMVRNGRWILSTTILMVCFFLVIMLCKIQQVVFGEV